MKLHVSLAVAERMASALLCALPRERVAPFLASMFGYEELRHALEERMRLDRTPYVSREEYESDPNAAEEAMK